MRVYKRGPWSTSRSRLLKRSTNPNKTDKEQCETKDEAPLPIDEVVTRFSLMDVE